MVHCRLYAYGDRDRVFEARDHVIRRFTDANSFSLFQNHGPLLFQYHGPLEYISLSWDTVPQRAAQAYACGLTKPD